MGTNPNAAGDYWVKTSTVAQPFVDTSLDTSRMDNMEKKLDKICERLAILEDPDPEKLKKFKMLKDAYTKYKFIEELCSEEDDDNG